MQFYADAHNLFDTDLKLRVEETIQSSTVRTSHVKFEGSGGYRTKQFLEKKYKDEPEVLAGILKNAQRIMHPTWEVEVFEDLELTGSWSNDSLSVHWGWRGFSGSSLPNFPQRGGARPKRSSGSIAIN